MRGVPYTSLIPRAVGNEKYAYAFLGASMHLYKRVCLSVGQSVGWYVGRLVRRMVGPSRVFFMAENAQTMNNEPTLEP